MNETTEWRKTYRRIDGKVRLVIVRRVNGKEQIHIIDNPEKTYSFMEEPEESEFIVISDESKEKDLPIPEEKPKKKEKKEKEVVLFNADVDSPINRRFQEKILSDYIPPEEKPIVFVPCSQTKRGQGGKTGYSNSPSHSFMSPITRDENIEKIVISDALVHVPYKYESQIPDYNYPIGYMSPDQRSMHIAKNAKFLELIKKENPTRKKIYYIGSNAYHDLLVDANKKAGNPFEIESRISGTQTLGSKSHELRDVIYMENPQIAQKAKQKTLVEFTIKKGEKNE